MSLLLAALATFATVGAGNQARDDAAETEKYQNLIDIEKFAQDTAIAQYNATVGLGQIESEQIASAAAMGKRSSGGSVANIQKVAREDQARNFARMDEDLLSAKRSGKVSRDAISRGASATNKAKTFGAIGRGLMTLGKGLA